MLEPEPGVGVIADALKTREHVVVRKRRRLEKIAGPWATARVRRRRLRIAVACLGALALMIAGLFASLSML